MKKTTTCLAVLTLLGACTPRGEDPWSAAALARLRLRERLAQLLVVPLDSQAAPLARWPGIGGVQVQGIPARGAALKVEALQRGARRPLLVVTTLDRGLGATLAGATELPPVQLLREAEDARAAARVVAAEAAAVGVNLGRLQVAPADPAEGTLQPTALEVFGSALSEQGVLAVAGAFGPDAAGAPLEWDGAALQAGPIRSLRRAARWAGAVELGWVAAPALTGDSTPLPLAPAADAGLLRRDLQFDGPRVADLHPDGEWHRRFGAGAALAALRSGADLLLGVTDPRAVLDSLAAAVADGRLPAQRVNQAAGRVFALKARLRLRPPVGPTRASEPLVTPPLVAAPEGPALAQRLLRSSLRSGGRPRERLRGCGSLLLAARDSAAIRELAAALRARLPRLRVTQGDTVSLGRFDSGSPACGVVVQVGDPGPALLSPPDTAAPDSAPERVVRVLLGARAGATAPDPWIALPGASPAAQRLAAAALLGDVPAAAAEWPPAPTLLRAPADSAGMRRDSLAAIDRAVRAALEAGVFTAAAVAVGRRGRLVKLTGYGRTGGRPVAPESTLFDVASLTKVIGTTAAAMVLVEEGEIELQAPLRRYLAGYRGGGRGDVTLRHLLTHTSGLPAGADLYAGRRSPRAALRRVIRTGLIGEPGERYVYSDFGMILLAEALEQRAGEPLEELLARRVYAPLGMRATRFRPSTQLQAQVVPSALRSERPYLLDGVVHDGNAFRLGGVAGHAGLFSTAADLAVFAQAILNGGAYGRERIWSARTVRRFATPQGLPGNRALGWDVPGPRSSAGDYLSARSIGHTGFTGTSLWIDPERELFVVLLTNRTYDRGTQAQIYALRRRVHELAARAIADQRIAPRPGTPAARAAERPRPRRPTPRRPRRPTRRG